MPGATAVAPDDALVMREIRNVGALSVVRTTHVSAATAKRATTEASTASDQDRRAARRCRALALAVANE